MKKQLVLTLAAVLISISMVFAQGGNGNTQRTPEEKVKAVMDKLTVLKLDKNKSNKIESVFFDYYKEQHKMWEELMASNNNAEKSTLRGKMQKLLNDREAKLKSLFTDEQYKKWKDEIEFSLKPQGPKVKSGNKK